MAENIYRFEFVDGTSQQIEVKTGIQDTLGSGISEKSEKTDNKKKTFSTQFTKKIEDKTLETLVVSPLNTVTGGLASPIVRTIKAIKGGATVGASLGTLGATFGIMLAMKGIEYLQTRMQELEVKVQNLNNTDNALIRAGSVSKATYYDANIFGIKKTTNRS